jgi:hypothetical protein
LGISQASPEIISQRLNHIYSKYSIWDLHPL